MVEYTPKLNLRKPLRGELNWDVPLNENFDILDKATLLDSENCIAVEGLKLNAGTLYEKKLFGDPSANTVAVMATSNTNPFTFAIAPHIAGNQAQIIMLNKGDPNNAGMIAIGILSDEVQFRPIVYGMGTIPTKCKFYDLAVEVGRDLKTTGDLHVDGITHLNGENVFCEGALFVSSIWGRNPPAADLQLWGNVMIPTMRPALPKAGSIYFNKNENKLYIHNGNTWCSVTLTPEQE